MATLTDVAHKAGVSPGLASRVLNNKMVMPIPQTTIERIKRAAAELEYHPNSLARALVTGRTHAIGLYYSNMTDPHFTRMLAAVEKKAVELGYHLLVSSDPKLLLKSGRADGVLAVTLPAISQLTEQQGGKPVTFVYPSREPQPNCVTWSDFEGARLAVQYLLDLGHLRTIVLLGNTPESNPPSEKVAGFRAALKAGGAQWREVFGTLNSDQIEEGRLLIHRLLGEREPFTAILARNDFLAVGAMQALCEAGIPVPQEVSVVGYNDTILARCTAPLLTSVRTPFAEAGVLALEKLVEAIGSDEKEFAGMTLPITLIERDSCAPPPDHARP